jgi:MFS family permease
VKRILAYDAIFEFGRMLVGAISAVYLLGRGMQFSDITLLKMAQLFSGVLLEVPTGIFADRFGQKPSLIISTLSGLLGFVFYFVGHEFWVFLLAEIFIASCLAFWSGAYESFSIQELQMENDTQKLDVFFHSNSLLNSFAISIAGGIGSVFSTYFREISYLPTISVFFLLTILLLMHQEISQRTSRANKLNSKSTPSANLFLVIKSLKENINSIQKDKKIRVLFFSISASSSLFYIVVYFWQVQFQNVIGASDAFLGLAFVVMNLSVSLASSLIVFLKSKRLDLPFLIPIGLIGYSIFLCLLSFSNTLFLGLIFFCLLEIFMTIASSQLRSLFNQKLGFEARSSTLSFLNLVVKLMGAIVLFIAGIVFKSQDQQIGSITLLFVAVGILTTIIGLLEIRQLKQEN